jgi:ATP-dependent RNA helicase SUPV3L1/SUV3
VACTVEMTDTDEVVDVAVIDEFQMLRDNERGWAWTRAILGIPAKEISNLKFNVILFFEKLLFDDG